MVYRLKVVRYKSADRRILLQNENGPCPLLAAANILLLRGTCQLPTASVRNGVASLEDVTNMLAEQAINTSMASSSSSTTTTTNSPHHAHYYVDELVQWIPKFQYGMDVNPSFTQGIAGYEYTAQLTAFDMLRCKLVHGWLVDHHDEETWRVLGTKTYNELVERVIQAKESQEEMQRLQTEIESIEFLKKQQQQIMAAPPVVVDLLDDDDVVATSEVTPTTADMERLDELTRKLADLQQTSHDALLIQHFFESSGHQLTHYGLMQLHEQLPEDELAVFFRNNHFGSLTKHCGLLYLLVTDLGYANSPAIVWERLDVIDGDTEYVNSEFKTVVAPQERLLSEGPTLTPEQMMAASGQSEADYQLALHLSMQQPQPAGGTTTLDEQEGQIMAAATEASLREYHGLVVSPAVSISEAKQQQGQAGQRVAVGVPVSFTPTGTIVQLPEIGGSKREATADTSLFVPPTHEDADRLLAMQLQGDQDQYTGGHHQEDASLHLARQLQFEEDQRARLAVSQQRQQPQQRPVASSSRSESGCVIS